MRIASQLVSQYTCKSRLDSVLQISIEVLYYEIIGFRGVSIIPASRLGCYVGDCIKKVGVCNGAAYRWVYCNVPRQPSESYMQRRYVETI
jgi:hypothetical protein